MTNMFIHKDKEFLLGIDPEDTEMAREEYGIPNSDGLEAYCAEDVEPQKRERSASQSQVESAGKRRKKEFSIYRNLQLYRYSYNNYISNRTDLSGVYL